MNRVDLQLGPLLFVALVGVGVDLGRAVAPRDRIVDDDLDIDSIDAVDLVARLRSITGKKIDPEMFKAARTVEDVVEAVFRLVNS